MICSLFRFRSACTFRIISMHIIVWHSYLEMEYLILKPTIDFGHTLLVLPTKIMKGIHHLLFKTTNLFYWLIDIHVIVQLIIRRARKDSNVANCVYPGIYFSALLMAMYLDKVNYLSRSASQISSELICCYHLLSVYSRWYMVICMDICIYCIYIWPLSRYLKEALHSISRLLFNRCFLVE